MSFAEMSFKRLLKLNHLGSTSAGLVSALFKLALGKCPLRFSLKWSVNAMVSYLKWSVNAFERMFLLDIEFWLARLDVDNIYQLFVQLSYPKV